MKEVHKDVYSKFSAQDTYDVFMNDYCANRVIISDLDGTIHRGRKPQKYRGVTLVDFSLVLARKLLLKRPDKLVGYIHGCLQTRRMERNLKGMVEEDDFPLSLAEDILMEYFCLSSLKGLPYKLVCDAGRNMNKLAYKKSQKTMLQLGKLSLDTLIVTKTLQPCLSPYISWFKENDLDVGWVCNGIKVEEGQIVSLDNRILTRKDKTLRLKELLDERIRHFGFGTLTQNMLTPLRAERELMEYPAQLSDRVHEALVFGDTDEDLGLAEALDELHIPYHLVAANINNGLSKEIASKADFIIEGWEGLHEFLFDQKAY